MNIKEKIRLFLLDKNNYLNEKISQDVLRNFNQEQLKSIRDIFRGADINLETSIFSELNPSSITLRKTKNSILLIKIETGQGFIINNKFSFDKESRNDPFFYNLNGGDEEYSELYYSKSEEKKIISDIIKRAKKVFITTPQDSDSIESIKKTRRENFIGDHGRRYDTIPKGYVNPNPSSANIEIFNLFDPDDKTHTHTDKGGYELYSVRDKYSKKLKELKKFRVYEEHSKALKNVCKEFIKILNLSNIDEDKELSNYRNVKKILDILAFSHFLYWPSTPDNKLGEYEGKIKIPKDLEKYSK